MSLVACASDDTTSVPTTTYPPQPYPPGTRVDINGDGVPDGIAVDINRDGYSDGVDTNGDGVPDAPLPGQAGTYDDAGNFIPTPTNPGNDAGTTLPPWTPTSTDFIEDRTPMSGLDQGTITALKGGGSSCSGVEIVYPYEGTAFPGGVLAPRIMWTGGGEAAYVKMEYDLLDNVKYEFAKAANGELQIPQADWIEITRRSQNSALGVTLNVKKGSTVVSCKRSWRIAQGNMVGSVYYNTYNHPEANGVGAVVRLTLGNDSSDLFLKTDTGAAPSGPCIACHSVSSTGKKLVASEHFYFPLANYFEVNSYELEPGQPATMLSKVADAAFGALTPEGDKILQMGNPQCSAGASVFPRAPNNFMLVPGPVQASLLSTSTGQVIPTKGIAPDHYMWMPQFSPKGDKVVFNHAKPDGKGGTDRRELAVMDFDNQTNTFSNLRVIVSNQGVAPSLNYAPAPPSGISGLGGGANIGMCTPELGGNDALAHIPNGSCTGPCYPAWPFFTPDGNGIIYALISEPDFAVAFPGRETPSKSKLYYVDLTTGESVELTNANKALANEPTDINYYPTVLPVQVGGYYWVFWTSTRKWGTHSTEAPPGVELYEGLFGASAREGYKKRLWVSAIKPRIDENGEFSGGPLTDPSLPAFYLEGQSDTGNVRAFAALNPCKPEGSECTSGLDCCTGYCEIKEGASKGTCVEEKACSDLNERCDTDEDCCTKEEGATSDLLCIGGYCGFVVF